MTGAVAAAFAAALASAAGLAAGVAGLGGGRAQFDYAVVPPLLFVSLLAALAKGGRVFVAAVCAGFATFSLGDAWFGFASTGAYVGGILPIADARGYLEEVLRLLAGDRFEAIAARRPIHAGVLAGFLWATGDLRTALAVGTFATGLALAAAVDAVARRDGALAASVFGVLAFLFARRFLGTALTESLAVPLSLFAFALIWRDSGDLGRIAAGLALLSLAMIVRAGPFFVLPFLAMALAWTSARRGMARRLAVLVVCAVAPFVASGLLAPLVALPGGALANAAQTLYGTLHGGDWTTYIARHPEMAALPDAELSRAIYADVWRTVIDTPGAVWDGVARAWGAFFLSSTGLVSFVAHADIAALRAAETMNARLAQAGWFVALGETLAAPAGPSVLARRAISLAIAVASAAALLRALAGRLEPRAAVALGAFWIGLVLSIPFLPPWDADSLRAYAAVIPFLCVGAALALRRAPARAPAPASRWPIALAAVAVAFLPLVGPLALGRGHPAADETCPHAQAPYGVEVAVAHGDIARWQAGLDVVSALYPRLGDALDSLAPPIVIHGVLSAPLNALIYRAGADCDDRAPRIEGFAFDPVVSSDRK
jgi:hypothetical protein